MKKISLGLILFLSGSLWADSVCAKGYITLRKGPGSQFPVSWKVAKHMPFLRLEHRGGWAKVQDVDGEIHWAKSSDVSSKVNCVVVKALTANLRREPSGSAPFADFKTLDRYTPLKKLANQREWIQVEDEAGHQSWIHESQVWKPITINTITF